MHPPPECVDLFIACVKYRASWRRGPLRQKLCSGLLEPTGPWGQESQLTLAPTGSHPSGGPACPPHPWFEPLLLGVDVHRAVAHLSSACAVPSPPAPVVWEPLVWLACAPPYFLSIIAALAPSFSLWLPPPSRIGSCCHPQFLACCCCRVHSPAPLPHSSLFQPVDTFRSNAQLSRLFSPSAAYPLP